jgi:glutathione S-transferase
MYRVYAYPGSGNCYKLTLMLTLLGEPFEVTEVDILAGATRTPAYLAINPNGKVPVLQLPDGEYLPESNAGLWYLAEGSDFLPDTRLGRARVLQWLSFEQYSHEPYIAVARFWIRYLGRPPEKEEELQRRQAQGRVALQLMEDHLAGWDWFVGADCTIADLALYAYTHVAEEGGFSLASYPALRRWLERVAALPCYVPMQ